MKISDAATHAKTFLDATKALEGAVRTKGSEVFSADTCEALDELIRHPDERHLWALDQILGPAMDRPQIAAFALKYLGEFETLFVQHDGVGDATVDALARIMFQSAYFTRPNS